MRASGSKMARKEFALNWATVFSIFKNKMIWRGIRNKLIKKNGNLTGAWGVGLTWKMSNPHLPPARPHYFAHWGFQTTENEFHFWAANEIEGELLSIYE